MPPPKKIDTAQTLHKLGTLFKEVEMPCYGNDVLKQESQGMLKCGRQKTFKGNTIFCALPVSGSVRCG